MTGFVRSSLKVVAISSRTGELAVHQLVELRRAGQKNPELMLARSLEAIGGILVGRKVNMREPGNGVPCHPVDIARQLARLNMRDGDVHVRARESAHEMLAPIADHQHDIGLQPHERIGEPEKKHTERLRHRRGVVPVERHVNAIGDVQSVLLDFLDGGSNVDRRCWLVTINE